MKVGVGFRVGKLRVTGLATEYGTQEQRRWRVICACGTVETRSDRVLIVAKGKGVKSACKRCVTDRNKVPW